MIARQKLFISIILVLIFASLASGCAALKEFFGFVTKIETTFEASPDLNPNAQGRPSPLVVRMYEFAEIDTFNNSDFFALYDNETETIGKEILAKDEFEIKPGDKKVIDRKTKPETRYIAVLAAYRDLDNAKWRASVKIPEEKTSVLTVHLGSVGVSITKQE